MWEASLKQKTRQLPQTHRSSMDTNQIALQLYTVREQTAQDMLGTLRQLAQMGYRAVEFAGYGGMPLRDMHATLDEIGIRAVAAHVPLNNLDKQLQQVLSDMHTL